jgi:hypothetical protein
MVREMNVEDKRRLSKFTKKYDRFSQLETTLRIIEKEPGIMDYLIRNKHPGIFTIPTIRKHKEELLKMHEERKQIKKDFEDFVKDLDVKGLKVPSYVIERVNELIENLERVGTIFEKHEEVKKERIEREEI